MAEQFLTVEDVAERLKVHHSTVRRWLKTRELRGYPLGDRAGWRIREADLMEFLERQRQAAGLLDTLVQRQGQAGVGELEEAFGHAHSRQFVEDIRDARVHLAHAQQLLDRMVAEGKFSPDTEAPGVPE